MSKEKKVNKLKYFNLKNKKKSFFFVSKKIYIYTRKKGISDTLYKKHNREQFPTILPQLVTNI